MGLDVYVGSFTRYYTGDWESVTARAARELGAKFETIRTDTPSESIRDPEQIHPIVLEWRECLSNSLNGSLPRPLDWNETSDAPYFTDKPDWDGYNALLLWAAYEEHPELRIPTALPDSVLEDAAYLLSTGEDSKTRYPALLSGAQIWFPTDFSFVFGAPDCAGREVKFASSISLTDQLEELNRRTWNFDQGVENAAEFQKPENDLPLERAARLGFGLFRRLSSLSARHRLPMLLDY